MEYRKQIMDLIVKIDKMQSKTEIKEKLADIVMHLDRAHHDTSVHYEMNDDNKVGCMPCVCQSKCGDVTVDIDVSVGNSETESPTKRCPLDCRK